MKLRNSCRSAKFVSGICLVLLFGGALFWAKEQDPFVRKWFTLKTVDHDFVKCVAVLPKPIRPHPVVIYAHGPGGTLMNDGNDLRQMAELGLATVSFEYNQTNEAAFGSQFEAVLRYLGCQKWADTNAIAWVGFSLGANRMLDFALQHPEQQPQLLIQLSGTGAEPSTFNPQPLTNLYCLVLLVHGEQDEIFPVANTKRLASVLQTNGLSVDLKIIPGIPHGMEPERGVVFRSIGEYCQSHLAGKNVWQNYHSIAQWQAEAPPFWLFWLPAAVWTVGWFAWSWHRKAASSEKIKLQRHEIDLRWLAVLLATWALVETAIHLVTPHFSISDTTLFLARRFLVQPKQHNDFEYLAAQPIGQGEKLNTLLEHAELAGYNHELINWQLDDKIYRDYVLSPIITGKPGEKLNWRRPLWEEFYPRIRHESSPEDAAKIVVRHLRERVTIATLPSSPHDVSNIWLKQITDESGFEIIYVAALRSVGVPARLDSNSRTEFWDDNKWQIAPPPPVISW
jgi:predicted esterase